MSIPEGEAHIPDRMLGLIGNLAEFHREHEKFYSQAPLGQSAELQSTSRVLKALAAHWRRVAPTSDIPSSSFAGAQDLNPPGLAAESGVLFMESDGEPAEIARIKREVDRLASGVEETHAWLSSAMERSWEVVGALAAYPEIADLLGERHRIVVNDWQSAGLQALIGKLLRRSLELLDRVDFTVGGLRADLRGPRDSVAYLYSASELIDRASDLLVESAVLVHDNERRWRVFASRVEDLQRNDQG